MTELVLAESVVLDLPLTVVWALTVFVAAALGGAGVLWITRGVRAETDRARAAAEAAAARTIEAQEREREIAQRHISELERKVADGEARSAALLTRISELEGTIKAVNDAVTARPAYAELTVYITRGFDLLEARAAEHGRQSEERHSALLAAINALGMDRRARRA